MIAENEKNIKVLLVEDDAEFARTMQFRITHDRNASIYVEYVQNLAHGLEAISQKNFDVLLLDLNLPDSRGLETYITLQAAAPDTPIIIITGFDDNDLALEAARQGAEDYLVKGEMEGKTLLRVIHHAIERNRIKKELAAVTRELRETNLRLEKMTLLDPLTELYNRRGLQQALQRETQWAARHNWDLVAMIIDIDHFKRINDVFGYAVGDIFLREVASTLKRSVRVTDHVGRIGGDEFIILFPETSLEEGAKVAERIRLAVANASFLLSETENISITLSAGILPVPKKTVTLDELLAIIHHLLKRSKKEGRNRITTEDGEPVEADTVEVVSQAYPRHNIQDMRDGTGYTAVKQPIMRLSDLSIVGYEFLSRMTGNGCTMPYDFFRIALENNILTLVDRHCFMTCVEASTHVANEMRCHVNILPSTMLNLPVRNLIDALAPGAGKVSYCFEISEQQIIGDPAYLQEAVQALKDAGVQVAVDDVGFGYSSLESLIAFEPDIIKIDKRYVNDISRDPKRRRSMQKILKIAQELNAEVIAEGIETRQDLVALQEAGVIYGQGFFLGMPA